MTAAIVYLLAVLSANLTATLFIPFPLFGQVAVGTLIFGITFTQRDRMHYKGRRFVYKVIALSAVLTLILLISCKYIWGMPFVKLLNSNGWEWWADGMSLLVAGGWRVFLASFLAILIAESTDTEIYHALRHKSWLGRVFRSNAVSIPVDSAFFNLIAFAGLFGWLELLSIIFGEIVTKFSVGAIYALLRPAPHLTERFQSRHNFL